MLSPILPGFDFVMSQHQAKVAEHRADNQRDFVEFSLRESAGDISRVAGEMERHSPLFFGSEANEQQGLF